MFVCDLKSWWKYSGSAAVSWENSLLPEYISATLATSHCLFVCLFFSTVKVIFWNGLGVIASRGSTALDTISSASAGHGVGSWWRIHSFCTCPGVLPQYKHTHLCTLICCLTMLSGFFMLFHVTTCHPELWMDENTHQPLAISFFLFFIYQLFLIHCLSAWVILFWTVYCHATNL